MNRTGLTYRGITNIDGPLVFIDGIDHVAYDELVTVTTPSGEERLGQVLDVTERAAVVQVFGGTDALSPADTRMRFLAKTLLQCVV